MSIQEYIEKIKLIQQNILSFIEHEENAEENFQNLIISLDILKNQDSNDLIELILRLICKITKNHYRDTDFYPKIAKILQFLIKETKHTLSNQDIFDIFKKSKRTLLLLIEEKLILVDESIAKQIHNYQGSDYKYYFFPEIEAFIETESKKAIYEKLFENKDKNYIEIFKEKRRIGQNDYNACELIRNDSFDEFKTNYIDKFIKGPKIPKSIFETNDLLLHHMNTSYMEYAAFFGSIKIFEYLFEREDVFYKKNIWLFAVHGRNNDIIQILLKNRISAPHVDYDSYTDDIVIKNRFGTVLEEVIKCHHNELTIYLLNNRVNKSDEDWQIENDYKKNTYAYAFRYCNFHFLPTDINYKYFFYYACQYNYFQIVELFVNNKKVDINESIILTNVFLF